MLINWSYPSSWDHSPLCVCGILPVQRSLWISCLATSHAAKPSSLRSAPTLLESGTRLWTRCAWRRCNFRADFTPPFGTKNGSGQRKPRRWHLLSAQVARSWNEIDDIEIDDTKLNEKCKNKKNSAKFMKLWCRPHDLRQMPLDVVLSECFTGKRKEKWSLTIHFNFSWSC